MTLWMRTTGENYFLAENKNVDTAHEIVDDRVDRAVEVAHPVRDESKRDGRLVRQVARVSVVNTHTLAVKTMHRQRQLRN